MASLNKQLVLTHVVKDASIVPSRIFYGGPAVEYANASWRMLFKKHERCLRVFLSCGKQGVDQWSMATNLTFTALSINGKYCTMNTQHTFTRNRARLYFDLPWDNIIKDEVKKELIIEISAAVGTTTGIERPEMLRDFNEPSAFTDVAIKVGEKKFFVSKVYMATQSENFKAMFFGGFEEANKDEVELKETDSEAFQNFLELMYMEDTLTDSNIQDVLVLVDKFVTKNPARLCEEFLINKSHHCNRTKLQIAGLYNFQALKTICLDNVKCQADIRAVVGMSTSEWDQSILAALLEKSLSFH